jgi:hypothetical protein
MRTCSQEPIDKIRLSALRLLKAQPLRLSAGDDLSTLRTAGLAALLVGVGGFAGEGRKNETKQGQPGRRPKMSTRKARAKRHEIPDGT